MTKEIAVHKEFVEKSNKYMEVITLLFVFLILCVFPLYYRDYYFDILDAKYLFYWLSVIILFLVFVISKICILYFDKKNHESVYFKSMRDIWRLTAVDKFLAAFVLICIVSTLQSDYVFESFTGNKGRYSGLFLILMYTISYFIVSKYFCFRHWVMDLFLLSGILVCLFGITDYFRMDLLHFKELVRAKQRDLFTSTIGNINTYTSYVALIMASATTLFTIHKNWYKKIWYFICMIISFFAIIMGVSDNAYLALAALFVFLPLYAFRTKSGLKSYFVSIASFFMVVQCIDLINQNQAGKTLLLDSVFQLIVSSHRLDKIVVWLWLIVAGLYVSDYILKDQIKYSGKKVCLAWLVLVVLLALGIVYILIDANIGAGAKRYGRISHYLIFNDEWGTHRGYIWRNGIENYMDFPIRHKIFGYGPETFSLLSIASNKRECVDLYQQIFDNAHNEYIQYFITIGPLGLISYLGFLISAGIRMVKRGVQNPSVMAIVFSIICYSAQAAVNINLPIVAPVLLTLLMVGLAGCRNTIPENKIQEFFFDN